MKPTLESLNEAAVLVGFVSWRDSKIATLNDSALGDSIEAHAITLDQLHGRSEMSEAESFYRDIMSGGIKGSVWDDCALNKHDYNAIKLLEDKFAELRSPREPEWIEWYGGDCPVDGNAIVEVMWRDGRFCDEYVKAMAWRWSWGQGAMTMTS